MKILSMSLVFSLIGFISLSSVADTLVTQSYEITITQNCEEGNVTCSDVTFISVDRVNGNSMRLTGATVHSLCADGVTPCAFQGYSFKQDDIEYFVGESGMLTITKGGSQVVLSEQGEWNY